MKRGCAAFEVKEKEKESNQATKSRYIKSFREAE
jgi:hypothetical protein